MIKTDSCPNFLRWFDNASGLSDELKITSFMNEVYAVDPAYYDFKSKSLEKNDEDIHKRILSIFDEFSLIRDKFIIFYNNLMNNLDRGLSLLNDTFPDFVIDIPFHICHSLGECDGGTRKLAGQECMILGLDVMAKVHTFDNEIPFIQHELFHIYHLQLYKPSNNSPYNEDALYNGLWLEGLATYISFILNPSASYAELLLDIPKDLVVDTTKDLKSICQALLDNFYSIDPDQYKKFFLFSSSPFPSRCGYYIGFLVVKAISSYTPFMTMIHFSEQDFIPLLEKELKNFIETS